MSTQERIYKVQLPDGSFRLVQTNSRRKALNHIADSLFAVTVASAEDLLEAKHEKLEIEYPGALELIDSSESPAN